MVVSHLLRQGLTITTNLIRTNFLENATHKRLFVKKFESLLRFNKMFYGSYQGDGRTVGFIINKRGADVLLISAVNSNGFILTSGVELAGPVILFPHSLFSWNVLNASEVCEDSLSLFKLMDPKVDILIFGYGSKNAYTDEIKNNFQSICKKIGIRFEALPTEHAIGVYNFLADERRLVAAALIPPTDFSPFRFDKDSDTLELEDLEEEDLTSITDGKTSKKLLK